MVGEGARRGGGGWRADRLGEEGMKWSETAGKGLKKSGALRRVYQGGIRARAGGVGRKRERPERQRESESEKERERERVVRVLPRDDTIFL